LAEPPSSSPLGPQRTNALVWWNTKRSWATAEQMDDLDGSRSQRLRPVKSVDTVKRGASAEPGRNGRKRRPGTLGARKAGLPWCVDRGWDSVTGQAKSLPEWASTATTAPACERKGVPRQAQQSGAGNAKACAASNSLIAHTSCCTSKAPVAMVEAADFRAGESGLRPSVWCDASTGLP